MVSVPAVPSISREQVHDDFRMATSCEYHCCVLVVVFVFVVREEVYPADPKKLLSTDAVK